jgi:hypothetical protein
VSSDVTAIAAEGYFSLFLKSDGSLWAMGDNTGGLTGDEGQFISTNIPEEIVSGNVTAIAAGTCHCLFLKSDGSLWAVGENDNGELGDGTYNTAPIYGTNRPEQIAAGTPGYNQISVQLLSGGAVGLSFYGMAGTNYELDRSFSLSPANWVPQATNPAGADGMLLFTNTPDATTNNFWRIRSVP